MRINLILLLFALLSVTIQAQVIDIKRISDINPGIKNAMINYPTDFDSILVFAAHSDSAGSGIWSYNYSSENIRCIKVIFPFEIPSSNTIGGSINNLSFPILDNKMVFPADDQINGLEMWVSDGSEQGTRLLKDINIGGDAAPCAWDFIQTLDTIIVFSATNADGQQNIYRTNGTEAGTYAIIETSSFFIRNLAKVSDKVYYSAMDEMFVSDLWSTDGTEDGTVRLTHNDLNPGNMTLIGNTVLFRGYTDTSSWELFKYIPELDTALLVKNIYPGDNLGCRGFFVPFDSLICFSGNTATHGVELWLTDGTAEGTRMIKDINPGNESGYDYNIRPVVIDSLIYFAGTDGVNGRELWRSNGTEEGTYMVKDINITGNGGPIYVTKFNDYVVFSADDGINGRELWLSDGTDTGTLLIDINESGSSKPTDFIVVDSVLFFAASENNYGNELYRLAMNAKTNIVASICQGENYFAQGAEQTEEGIYCDTLSNVYGLDSIVITTLTVNPVFESHISTTIYQGDSLFVQGGYQKEAGVYYDTLTSIHGCDSVIVTELSVKQFVNATRGNLEPDLSVYPIPAKGFLHIDVQNLNKVNIYNNQGKLIITSVENTINLHSISPGIYTIHVFHGHHQCEIRKIIIIED